ncbi:GNAT family N-acetyltransferase [Microbacterium sp. NPDC089189]|uniref:GNAT family N-acetyltransferase n=1 Tax=Microbacterium sp. NPDC089189 TaxID=3154972 RepID=UPI00344313D9
MSDIRIRPIEPDDAGETLTLQRAAFVQEAQIYGGTDMPALTQTLEQVAAELSDNLGSVALLGTRMVGVVRARRDDDLLLIGRLAIAPDVQGAGIGSALLAAAEERGRDAGCTHAELFTGSMSEANLRLYRREGYVESERVPSGEGVAEIYLRKQLG